MAEEDRIGSVLAEEEIRSLSESVLAEEDWRGFVLAEEVLWSGSELAEEALWSGSVLAEEVLGQERNRVSMLSAMVSVSLVP